MTDEAPATLYESADGVATITLNRPDRRNSFSPELVTSLGENLERAAGDSGVRAIVLTNVGNTFCGGADLKASSPGVGSPGSGHTLVDVFCQILDGPKPVIGRIDGHVTGGGVGLAAACDLSVMRDDAKIGFTEVRLGVAPALISVICLPKMRRADASELFLTGELFTPTRAAEVGLVNAAVPATDLDEAVTGYVSKIARGGPQALAAAKELIRRVPHLERSEAFRWAAARSNELFASGEAAAGIAAFREQRDAPWVPAND